MIYLLFSTQSAGSTFIQTKLSNHIDIVRPDWQKVRDVEFSLLDWGSYFAWYPKETIDFEPCRTRDPKTGREVVRWRENYRDYLTTYSGLIGRDFFDHETRDWFSVERFFLEQIVGSIQQKYKLPVYSSQKYGSRLDYVIDLFRAVSQRGDVFGKNPKYLNDFSGSTIRLLDILMDAGVPIRGIFLQRCPLNTFTSILERKFRLDEMFGGDMEQYEDFVFDALEFSISTGNKVSDRYDFLRIRYEELGQEFPRLLDYMEIQDGGSKLAGFQKKYHRRYILNPRARARYESLKTFARKLGYDGKQYPKKVGVGAFLAELCGTLIRVQRSHKSNVNNPERPWGVIKKVFWLEVQTDKFNGLRKIYKYWKNK